MGIKGRTIFELTDVNTGEVERYEDCNMVTNALQYYLETYGMFTNNILANDDIRGKRLWKNLVGGLFLFDKNIEENVENTFMPAGVSMIGNGSIDISNSGDVTELGSYNATESGLQDDGSIKFVYDFSTQQANGTIACACLTSASGGYVGMGNASGNYITNSNKPMYYGQNSVQKRRYPMFFYGNGGRIAQCFAYATYADDTLCYVEPSSVKYDPASSESHWSNTGKIKVYKLRANLKSISIKDYQNFDKSQVLETYDIDIPQEILDYMGTSTDKTLINGDAYEKSIFITFNKSGEFIRKGSFAWVMKIDENMTATAYKITNNTGYEINAEDNDRILYHNGYAWVVLNGIYKLVGIKYTDSTQIIDDNIELDGGNSAQVIGKGLLLNGYPNGRKKIYDIVNHTSKIINASYDGFYIFHLTDREGIYLKAYVSGLDRNDAYYILMKDDRYLATINNLAEPVVKTSSKTMKVTYTLTFEE